MNTKKTSLFEQRTSQKITGLFQVDQNSLDMLHALMDYIEWIVMNSLNVWQNDPLWRDDPIWQEQLIVLRRLLAEEFTEAVSEGFRIVAGRFVNHRGRDRTALLRRLFRTNTVAGKRALRRSLESVQNSFGSFERFENEHEVTIVPPRPAFVMIQMLGIDLLSEYVYRVGGSADLAWVDGVKTSETVVDFVRRTGRMPYLTLPPRVSTQKPHAYWFSYQSWENPTKTSQSLQIWQRWSDCRIRFTIATANITTLAYIPFNGDKPDPKRGILAFDGYFHEPVATDHPTDDDAGRVPLAGGGTQLSVFGGPRVAKVEEWVEGTGWKDLPIR